ncbi:MAG: energy transducer TonB [Kofleriaceae bacterium]
MGSLATTSAIANAQQPDPAMPASDPPASASDPAAPPPASPPPAGPAQEGPPKYRWRTPDFLSRDMIEYGLRGVRIKVMECEEKWPQVDGTLLLEAQVAPDGRVVNPRVTQPVHEPLDQCVLEAAQSAKFIETRQGGAFMFEWTFVPSDAKGPPRAGRFWGALDMGGMHMRMNIASIDTDVTGLGFHMGIMLGGTVARSLALYMELTADAVSEPTFESGTVTQQLSDSDALLTGISAGVLRWFGASGWCGGASLGLARMTLNLREGDTLYQANSEIGWTGKLELGYRHRITERAALGIIANARYANVQDKDNTGEISGHTLSLAVSLSNY